MDRPYGISDFAFPNRWDRESGPDVVERAGRASQGDREHQQIERDAASDAIRSRSGFDRSRTIYRGRNRDYSLRESEVRTLTDVGKFRVAPADDLARFGYNGDLKVGFALACRKAGISDVSWHTLRHTFASRLIDRGVDIVTVQQLLGHSTVTVTMRYTDTNLDSKRAAVAKLVSFGDNLVTVAPKCSNRNARLSQIASNPQNTLELKTEEWVSG